MKKISLAATCAAALVITGCDKENDDPGVAESNIVQVVVNSNDFTLLEAAVIKAGLANALSNTANLTVFAPDDAAFRALDLNGDGTPDLDTEAKINALDATGTALLTRVLNYHVLGMRVPAASVPAGPNAPVESLDGENIFATRNAAGVFVNGIQVQSADIAASNGIIHRVGRVLIPSGGQNIVQVASANPNFTYLVAAVVKAGESGTDVAGALSAAGPLTVFAPTNQAFIAAGFPTIASIQAANPNTLRDILLNHVVAARVFSSDLTEGATPAAAGGGDLTITLAGGAKVRGEGNTEASNIVMPNVLASNGVIHVIDAVLLP